MVIVPVSPNIMAALQIVGDRPNLPRRGRKNAPKRNAGRKSPSAVKGSHPVCPDLFWMT